MRLKGLEMIAWDASVVVAVVAVLVSLASWVETRRSGKAEQRSADAAQRSADAAQRSADAAQETLRRERTPVFSFVADGCHLSATLTSNQPLARIEYVAAPDVLVLSGPVGEGCDVGETRRWRVLPLGDNGDRVRGTLGVVTADGSAYSVAVDAKLDATAIKVAESLRFAEWIRLGLERQGALTDPPTTC